jgi:hypothetical protein
MPSIARSLPTLAHNAEGHFPGLEESLVSEPRERGVVPEKSRRLQNDSAAWLARALECGATNRVVGQFDCGRLTGWKTGCPGRIFAGWHERNTNPC